MNNKGFTMIEALIVIAIVGIIAAIAVPLVIGISPLSKGNISFGLNGATETRCINGYLFVVGADGGARQVLDEFGKGTRCE